MNTLQVCVKIDLAIGTPQPNSLAVPWRKDTVGTCLTGGVMRYIPALFVLVKLLVKPSIHTKTVDHQLLFMNAQTTNERTLSSLTGNELTPVLTSQTGNICSHYGVCV